MTNDGLLIYLMCFIKRCNVSLQRCLSLFFNMLYDLILLIFTAHTCRGLLFKDRLCRTLIHTLPQCLLTQKQTQIQKQTKKQTQQHSIQQFLRRFQAKHYHLSLAWLRLVRWALAPARKRNSLNGSFAIKKRLTILKMT